MLNKVMLIGYAGRDAETKGAGDIASFSLATTEKYTDKSGQKVDKTEWHNVTAFGKLAEVVSAYVRKGVQVYVEGKIETREATGPDGAPRKYINIVASVVRILTPHAGAQQAAPSQPQQRHQPLDDDMPF